MLPEPGDRGGAARAGPTVGSPRPDRHPPRPRLGTPAHRPRHLRAADRGRRPGRRSSVPAAARRPRRRGPVGGGAANTRKAGRAAAATTAQITAAFAVLGPDNPAIPAALRDAGRLRLAHPELSLAALAQLAQPPLTKDTLHGRIRRLLALADRHHPHHRHHACRLTGASRPPAWHPRLTCRAATPWSRRDQQLSGRPRGSTCLFRPLGCSGEGSAVRDLGWILAGVAAVLVVVAPLVVLLYLARPARTPKPGRTTPGDRRPDPPR